MRPCVAALIVAVVAGQQVDAGSIVWGVEVKGAFDPNTFDPLPIPDTSINHPEPIILELGLRFSPTPAVGERDFLNFALDIGLLGDITDPGFGYIANPSPMVDTSPAPGDQLGPVFPTNQDAGAADLQSIVLSKTAPLSDIDNRTLYDDYPYEFGVVFLIWGGTEAQLEFTGEASFNLPGGTTQPDTQPFEPFRPFFGGHGDPPILTDGSVAFTYNGEIQTLVLESVGFDVAIFDGAPFFTGPDAELFTLINPDLSDMPVGETREFQVMFGGDIPNLNATYEARLNFPYNNDGQPAVWDLTATVPEPSNATLTCLALFGLIGFVRSHES